MSIELTQQLKLERWGRWYLITGLLQIRLLNGHNVAAPLTFQYANHLKPLSESSRIRARNYMVHNKHEIRTPVAKGMARRSMHESLMASIRRTSSSLPRISPPCVIMPHVSPPCVITPCNPSPVPIPCPWAWQDPGCLCLPGSAPR